LENSYHQKVSLPTIINRAKKNGFYLPRSKKTAHDREVLTHYAGKLIQHDSSYHLWAPAAQEKWYLITSRDDYSRFDHGAKAKTSHAKTQSAPRKILGLRKNSLITISRWSPPALADLAPWRDSYYGNYKWGDCQIRTKWNKIEFMQEEKLLSEIRNAQISLTPKCLFSIFAVSKSSSCTIK
jgi:hypothetical protein